ncbi:MAG: 23S rRNA (pseudouridine(1915)-N(3))-methyltransferase RlmH [Erysipelotrichaceae bacterium]|nr:23S rRNA (pseudouridine(1915)-N(3))-methyltransferase RlmH [Erysipelotrichaceae bacterium]
MIRILCIGKNKDASLRSLEKEYIKRCSPFSKVQVQEVKDEPTLHTDRIKEVQQIKETEGQRVLKLLKPDDFVILLDLHGSMMDSEGFARKLSSWQMEHSSLVFVIAGSLGPSQQLVDRAQVRWKLSDLTFTHLMTRILVLEQIYRGFSILHQRNYHK